MRDRFNLILVEGIDDINYFGALTKYVGINNCEIKQCRGTYNFKNTLPEIFMSSDFFEKYKSIGIIKDADKNCQSSFDSIVNILTKIKNVNLLSFDIPNNPYEVTDGCPRLGIYIMPGNHQSGSLEDLCLRTIKNQPIYRCIDDYLNCIKSYDILPSNISKSKCKIYLASMPELVNCVGLGAQKHYWDFDSEEIKQLKDFISLLCN